MNDERSPYVGLQPYGYADADIFFERANEAAILEEMVLSHRVTMLYGDSGNGKSSLVNAGLVPRLLKNHNNIKPERLRVDSMSLKGFVLDAQPLSSHDSKSPFHSFFYPKINEIRKESDNADFSLDIISITEQLSSLQLTNRSHNSATTNPLPQGLVFLIFDQFEELFTLAGGRSAFSLTDIVSHTSSNSNQACNRSEDLTQLATQIGNLLEAEDLPVRFLFSFREEFLVKLHILVPALRKAAGFRLPPIKISRIKSIIYKPFQENAPFFGRDPDGFFKKYAEIIEVGFQLRSGDQAQHLLTEMQLVCMELWTNQMAREEISTSEVDGTGAISKINEIILRHFKQSLDSLNELKGLALELLCEMVTASNTRDIASEESLKEMFSNPIRLDENIGRSDDYSWDNAKVVLIKLGKMRFINASTRNGAEFYDLASESLIPWLSAERNGRLQKLELDRTRYRLKFQRNKIILSFTLLTIMISVIIIFISYHGSMLAIEEAQRRSAEAEQVKKEAQKDKDEAAIKQKKAYNLLTLAKEREIRVNATLEQQSKDIEAIVKDNFKAATLGPKLTYLATKLDKLKQSGRTDSEALIEILAIWDGKEIPIENAQVAAGSELISRTSAAQNAKIDINQAVFSRDGFCIATAGQDGQLKLWSCASHSAKLIDSKVASSSKGGVLTLTFSSTGLRIITGSAGQSIRAFTHEIGQLFGKEYQYAEKQDDTVMDLECMPESENLFAASYGNGVTKILSLSPDGISNFEPPVIWSHGSKPALAMTSVAFSRDGTRAVTSSDDGRVAVWSSLPPYALVTDDLQENPADCNATTRHMIFSPTDSSLVVGGAGTKVVFWRVGSGKKMRLLDKGNSNLQHEGGVWQVAFHPTGRSFASIATDGKCILWQVPVDAAAVPQGLEVETKIQGRLLSSIWAQNSLILGGEDGSIELWHAPPDAASPILIKSFKAHEGAVWGMTLSPDGKQLLTWSGTDRNSGNLPSPRGTALTYCSLNPIKSDGTAAVWDLDKLLKTR